MAANAHSHIKARNIWHQQHQHGAVNSNNMALKISSGKREARLLNALAPPASVTLA